MGNAFDFLLHLDRHLDQIATQYGAWTYGILFAIVFCETGLVFMPFLPGDSLLFTVGALAKKSDGLNPGILAAGFVGAAFLGDNLNYCIGRYFGKRLFNRPKSKIFNQENLDKTHAFMERHGHKAIVLARFTPFIRSFLPFVAGMGEMNYKRFLGWSVVASVLWVLICGGAGYLFGSIPIVEQNFSLAILAIICLTLIPIAIEVIRHRRKAKALAQAKSE